MVGLVAGFVVAGRHAGDQLVQGGDIGFRHGGGGDGSHLALDQDTRLDQLEGADVEVVIHHLALGFALARRRLTAGRLDDIDAGSVADFDDAENFQGDHRLAHRRAADAERLGQFALGRQFFTGPVNAVANRLGQLIGDTAVKANGFMGGRGGHDGSVCLSDY